MPRDKKVFKQTARQTRQSVLASVRSVHSGDFSGDVTPLQLALWGTAILKRQPFLKFEQLIHEAQVRLNDNIQAPSTHITASIYQQQLMSFCLVKKTYYARGRDSLRARMTSAMQIVADRETPTRQ